MALTIIYLFKIKSAGTRTGRRVTFLARPRNVTQRMRPSNKAFIYKAK